MERLEKPSISPENITVSQKYTAGQFKRVITNCHILRVCDFDSVAMINLRIYKRSDNENRLECNVTSFVIITGGVLG